MKNRVWKMPEKQHLVMGEEELAPIAPDQVLVRVAYCGICGSDMHFFQNGAIGTRQAPPDFILGHEVSGVVVQTGEAVTSLREGDRVALEPGIPCGKCPMCRTGKYNLCPDVHFLAAARPATDGALREYMVYPAEYCFKLPQQISLMEGCMIEPLAVGMHAARRGEAALGKCAAIIGLGTIGYMTMLSVKAMGVSKIIVSDALPNRIKLAEQFGVSLAVNAREEDVEARIFEATNGEGADIVFETAGSPYTLKETWKYVRRGGVIVNVGNAGGDIPYRFDELARKEADIRHVWRYRHIFPVAIEAVCSGQIDLKSVNPAVFPFEEAQEAFEYALRERSQVLKTIIRCSDDAE